MRIVVISALILLASQQQLLAYAEYSSWSSVPADVHVNVSIIKPKYSVEEAIEVCVNDMIERGEPVTEINLRKALTRMSKADVMLPQTGFNTVVRNAVQKYQARIQKKIMQENPPPKATDYRTQKAFVAAYVAYKMENITPHEKEFWRGKIGGLNEFRRAMKNEALKIWQGRR